MQNTITVSSFYKCHILFHSGLPITNKMKQITAENIRKCLLISSQAIISCSKQNKWKYKADVRLSKKLRWIRSRKKTKKTPIWSTNILQQSQLLPVFDPRGWFWLAAVAAPMQQSDSAGFNILHPGGMLPPPPRLFH